MGLVASEGHRVYPRRLDTVQPQPVHGFRYKKVADS